MVVRFIILFISDSSLFPNYVLNPVENYFEACEAMQISTEEMYTDIFLSEFQSSIYFNQCKNFVEGKLSWNPWLPCSVSCNGGIRIQLAEECIPNYSRCDQLPVKQEICNTDACPFQPTSFDAPPGTILAWIPKPNKNSVDGGSTIPENWIKCDGIEKCPTGPFINEICSDLSNRGLIGSGIFL